MFGHGREVCTCGDSFSNTFFLLSGRAPLLGLLEALRQMYLECKQCWSCLSRSIASCGGDRRWQRPHACRSFLRRFEGRNTSRQNRPVGGNCARTSGRPWRPSSVRKRWRRRIQFARVDGVDTKRLRDTLSKSSQFRIQIVPVATRPNGFFIISHTFRVICLVVGSPSGLLLCCWGLPDHGVQNTVLGRLTQTSQGEVEPSSAWLLWKTGHRARTEAAPTATTSQIGRISAVWRDGQRMLGPPPNGARRCEISMSTRHQRCRALASCWNAAVACSSMTQTTRWEFNCASPWRRVMMSFFEPRQFSLAEQSQHTLDQELPRLALARSASQEAQQCRGLQQTSWLEFLPDSVAIGFECGIPRRLTRRGSYLGAWRLRRSSWTTTIAPTASSWRHI